LKLHVEIRKIGGNSLLLGQVREVVLYLWNAGSMLPERTTTMGDSLPVTTIKPFQIINAEETIMPKDNT